MSISHLITSFFLSVLLSSISSPVFAQNTPSNGQSSQFGEFEVGLPGIPAGESIDSFVSGGDPILKFINFTVNAIIAILVVMGVITIVAGGYIYMTAAGDGSKVKMAKDWIIAALVGIFLALISVVILNVVNRYLGGSAQEPRLGEQSGISGEGGGNNSTGGNPSNSGNGDGSSGGSGSGAGDNGSGNNSTSGDNTGGNNNDSGGGSSGGGNSGNGGNNGEDNFVISGDFPFTNDSSLTIMVANDKYYIHTNTSDLQVSPEAIQDAVERLRLPQDNVKIRIYSQPSSARQAFNLEQFLYNSNVVNQSGVVTRILP